MNKMTFEKLQYNELKHKVKTHCVSSLGKQLIETLQPSTNIKVVRHRLNETSEARKLLDAEKHLPLTGISNITSHIEKVEKGMVLTPGELLAISDFLRGCRKIKKFMADKEFFAPVLYTYAISMTELRGIEEEILFAIKGNRVDSGASKELKRIRNQIAKNEEKIEERLNKFLKSGVNKEYLQESYISKKNDRFTIPIKASFKNHVPGTIIETSSKGSTVFIEPEAVSKLNVELLSLKSEESVEEYQILATLTGAIYESLHEITVNIECISQYDMIFAKAKYSKSNDAIEPKINDYGYIKLIQSKHPLLEGNIVPLDFEIGENYRSLVITGPNAGGKTVVLKTIGMLTLAVMSGFHISAKRGTELAIFDHVFVDIGDNQSIENALSTFSSHMKNIAEIMSAANNNTLLLFDEIGSGTEPNEGAALAIAILEEFYHIGCITVATTHYGEIKRYSEMHDDFMNAAMLFNSAELKPMYKLLIGKSGDSNALWISSRMKIRKHVLERAQLYIDNKNYNLKIMQENKRKKPVHEEEQPLETYQYETGDRVRLINQDDFAIVYEPKDTFNNIKLFYNGEIVEVNSKRIELDIKATQLYPEGYDVNTLFTSYEDRKLQHDLERGSKKALRKVQKEIRNRNQE
ncbi:endonuclease MutS2 [Metabacillus malikii]|uniref:DsDNA-specific endonuclease/ATPase MutS2 n=1 Tax=Metabacillus malikii TaxID=1504265 RepID=A0ABT9ZLU0_9BACI|nr:endonuclease MutS2 [Metabacillus malikii]MDQ0233261.1 dsDNA-specific endonuclease/ATPase MutS2 [Metabacillus malikii]